MGPFWAWFGPLSGLAITERFFPVQSVWRQQRTTASMVFIPSHQNTWGFAVSIRDRPKRDRNV